jgi:hypothetical protein
LLLLQERGGFITNFEIQDPDQLLKNFKLYWFGQNLIHAAHYRFVYIFLLAMASNS